MRLLLCVGLAACAGEPPPAEPAQAATVEVEPAPSASAPEPEPAPVTSAPPDAGADAGPSTVSPVAACCAALTQSAASAPPGQKGSYIAAAGACNAVRNQPSPSLSGIRALLGGARLPAACR